MTRLECDPEAPENCGMTWDPYGTIGAAIWICGGQWAGKSTVANILASRHGITAYHHDYHAARGHYDRQLADQARRGEPVGDPNFEEMWIRHPPEELAAEVLAGFPRRFEWVLDDLRALVSGRPVLAEGWGLRPELVAGLVDSPRRALVMVPTDDFRQHQERVLDRARSLGSTVSDPELGQRNRVARDRIIADDAVTSARRHSIEVLEVDGSLDAEGVATEVEQHFAPYLRSPAPRSARERRQTGVLS